MLALRAKGEARRPPLRSCAAGGVRPAILGRVQRRCPRYDSSGMDAEPAFQIPAIEGPLDVDLEKDGDEWVAALWRALRRTGPVGEQRVHWTAAGPFLAEFSAAYITSKLRLMRGTNNEAFPFAVDTREPKEDELERWRQAITEGTDSIGRTRETFAWRAVLGPAPLPGNYCDVALATAGTVGPMKVRPGGVQRVDYAPQPGYPSFGSHSILESWPVFVDGESSAYSWTSASNVAARNLNQLAGLLSLLWDSCWVIRHAPAPGALAITSIPPFDWGAGPVSEGPGKVRALPSWADAAWAILQADTDLAASLAAHHEGTALFNGHPSIALVTFVATVEGIGARGSGDPPRCPKCRAQQGAAERFLRAVQRVLPGSDAQSLKTIAYERRSQTAHAGALHGYERQGGTPFRTGVFGRPVQDEFLWNVVRRMQAVSRAVLLDAIEQQLKLARQPAGEAT